MLIDVADTIEGGREGCVTIRSCFGFLRYLWTGVPCRQGMPLDRDNYCEFRV